MKVIEEIKDNNYYKNEKNSNLQGIKEESEAYEEEELNEENLNLTKNETMAHKENTNIQILTNKAYKSSDNNIQRSNSELPCEFELVCF
jgi:hypothetical protein